MIILNGSIGAEIRWKESQVKPDFFANYTEYPTPNLIRAWINNAPSATTN